MCGFVGVFGKGAFELIKNLHQALDQIAHRGPDGKGSWISQDKVCFLGHRRLAILDLSLKAQQPFIRGDQILVYNGEIYNHFDIRKEIFPAFSFETHSDTETLFYLLKKLPFQQALPRLEGMFAGALYDEEVQKLILFRDHLGIKPLYYTYLEDGTILFSSEIKGIFALSGRVNRLIDDATLNKYFLFENWEGDSTFFKDIKLLNPGETLELKIKKGRVSLNSSYFQKASLSRKKISSLYTVSSSIQCIRDSLESTVKKHLLSDVPIGVYLSGGLDSGIIATLSSRFQDDILAFIGYFEKNEQYDERSLARITAHKANIPLIEVNITPKDFTQHFDQLVWALEEPRMGMGSFSQFIVAKEAAQHRKVILTGHGGDELFAGYPLFKSFSFFESFPKWNSFKILGSLSLREWPWVLNNVKEFFLNKHISFAPSLYLQTKTSKDFMSSFVAPRSHITVSALFQYYQEIYIQGLLLVEDKISMFHGLETRVPLWSQQFVEKMNNIPVTLKLHEGELKGLYKKALETYLPQEILNAPKKGFPTPLRHWFRKELKGEIEQRLLETKTSLYDITPKSTIQKLLWQHCHIPVPFPLDEKRAHKIWMLLCIESWLRQYKATL